MESNKFYLNSNEVRGSSSPHGMHNYFYNYYDRWSDLCIELEGQSTQNVYCEKPMVENCHNNSGFGCETNSQFEPLHLSKEDVATYYDLNGQPIVETPSRHLSHEDVMDCVDGRGISEGQMGNHDNALMMDSCSFDPLVLHHIENPTAANSQESVQMVDDCNIEDRIEADLNHDSEPMMDSCSFNYQIQLHNNDNSTSTINVCDETNSSKGVHLEENEGPDEMVLPISIELTQIDNTMNFSDQRGFVYSLNNYKPEMKHLYFRCKNSSGVHMCSARAKAKNRNLQKATLTSAHTHFPDENVLQKTKFDGILDEVIESNKFMSTRELYFKAREKVPADKVQFIPLRTSYAPFVHRRKREFIPKIPKTIDEFEELINNEEFQSRYCLDSRNQTFYRGVWTDKNGNKMVVFISESGVQVLKELKIIELLMDGTFKVLPRHIHFCQLYVMSFLYEERCYPFTFVFMEKRDTDAYDLLFQKLVAMITPECAAKVLNCMSDYEHAVRAMCKKHFPNARIGGCYFHYVKAVNKRARKFGLSKDVQFQQPIREMCALALFPNDFILKGFESIVEKTPESSKWIRFNKYWRRTWLNANISVYGLKNRTDNFSEAFNRSFNLLNGKPHQNIWIVLKNLKQMEMDKTDELLKHRKGKMFRKRPDKIAEKLNEKIRLATARFDETEDVVRFLENITQDDDFQRACMQNHLLEDSVDYGQDDIDNEEFIANDFDANSDFQRKQIPTVNRKRKAVEDTDNANVKPSKAHFRLYC